MAERHKLTMRMIKQLKPVDKETWLMDSEVVGFGIRQRPGGKAVFAMRWKDRSSRDRKYTIADVNNVTLVDARAIARQRFGEIERGVSPLDSKRSEKRQAHTVGDMFELLIEDMQSKGRATTYMRDFRQQARDYVLPAIGTMLVREVGPTDIDRILSKLRDKASLHNRVRALLSRVFKQAVKWRYRPDDPTLGTSPQSEGHRERLLKDDEVDAILDALNRNPGPSSDAMRLLYLTGSRPKELFGARWCDLDLDAGVWVKPSQLVKQRRSHRVELHGAAVAVFKRIKEQQEVASSGSEVEQSAFVFPSKSKSGHITTIKRHAATIFREAGVEDVRPYDLRKAFASRLMASGVDLRTVMSLTGHTQLNVLLRHYAHVMPGKQREALKKMFG